MQNQYSTKQTTMHKHRRMMRDVLLRLRKLMQLPDTADKETVLQITRVLLEATCRRNPELAVMTVSEK